MSIHSKHKGKSSSMPMMKKKDMMMKEKEMKGMMGKMPAKKKKGK